MVNEVEQYWEFFYTKYFVSYYEQIHVSCVKDDVLSGLTDDSSNFWNLW